MDELVIDAERVTSPDVRDQRLADAAYKALLQESDAEKAQTIASRIKNRKNFDYLYEEIGEALPLTKARRGEMTEVRKTIAAMKTKNEKISLLTELAFSLAEKGDNETAKSLLDEAMAMMPLVMKNYNEIEPAMKIAAVYAVVSPDKAFKIIEKCILQSDEYINAGIKMDEFYFARTAKGNELLFSSINRQFLMHIPNSTDLIRNLARADFERTVGLADKFRRPEIRLFVRLRVLESLLDANAAEKEREAREQLAGDGET